MKNKVFKWIVSVGLTAALVFILSTQISFKELGPVFSGINWFWILFAMGIYFVSTIVRAYRFRILGITQISIAKLVKIGLVHFLLANILPFRSGELSFVYLANKEKNGNLPLNISALLLSRIFDFLAVVIGLIISMAVLFPEKLLSFDPIVVGSFIVLLFLIALLFLLIHGSIWLRRFVVVILNFIGRKQPRFSEKLIGAWTEFEKAVQIAKSPKVFFQALGLSILTWNLFYFETQAFLAALSEKVDYWQAAFLTGFPPIASLIPLGTLGNFGTVEAGWVFGLNLINFNLETALVLAVTIHLLSLFVQVLVSALSFLIHIRL